MFQGMRSGEIKILVPEKRRKGNKKYLEIVGAKENKLVALPVNAHKCFVKHFLQEIKSLSNGFPITEIIYLNFIHSEINFGGCCSLCVAAEQP